MARVTDHVPCTALYVENVEQSLKDAMAFLEALGEVRRDGFSVTCLVDHPDQLVCLFKAEVSKLVDGNHIMEFTRLRGDLLLFALLLREHRVYLATGMLPILFRGELMPRCRLGPSTEPRRDIPPLALPPAE